MTINKAEIKEHLFRAGRFIIKNRSFLLSFFLPPLILFVSYIFFKVYPFGERSVLSLDLNAQYVYYYDYMYDVFAGKESLFYSWSRNLSGEFMGIIGYYLASPFNFLVWIYPRTMITEGLLTMMLAKSACSGLACCFFLKKHRGFSDSTAVCFSVMWALCGFFVVQTMNPMWLDGLIALPLVVMGIERICDKRKFLLYILSLFYIFVANFYIGYMVGIFSALYFVYYLASGRSENKVFGEYCGAVIMFGTSSVTAILMSCFMILPVYKSLSNGKFEFSGTPDYSLAENFSFADVFIKLFPGEYDTVNVDGLPILYCGVLALVCGIMYFMHGGFSARERISSGVLLGVLAVSMYIRPVDMMWHGGQLPNWLPYRYSFMISFLLISLGAQTFEKMRAGNPAEKPQGKSFGSVFLILLAMLIYADLKDSGKQYHAVLSIVIPLGIVAVIMIMLWIFRKYGAKKAVVIPLVVLICGELGYSTTTYLYRMHKDIVFSTRDSYRGDIPFTRKVTEQVHEQDESFYRMEKTFHRCVNDAIALRMYGMSHSSSMLNAKAIKLLKSLGYAGREHYTRYDGSTMLLDDIFGVKYILAENSSTLPYKEKLPLDFETDIKVYKNEDALGIAYLANDEIIGYNLSEYSPFLAQNKLAAMLSGVKGSAIFKPIDDVEFDSENIKIGSTTDGHHSYRKVNADNSAWIEYTLTAQQDGPVYMYLPTDYEREVQYFVNDDYRGNYYLVENYSVEYLGSFKKGEEFRVKLKLLDKAVYFTDAWFYYIDSAAMERFRDKMQQLNSSTMVVRAGGCKLNITVNAFEDCALFTSIPYEEGWTAVVDGRRVGIEACLDNTLMTIPISKGQHTIELSFFPAGLKTGLILSGLGMAALAVMLVSAKLIEQADKKAAEKAQNSHETPPETSEKE